MSVITPGSYGSPVPVFSSSSSAYSDPFRTSRGVPSTGGAPKASGVKGHLVNDSWMYGPQPASSGSGPSLPAAAPRATPTPTAAPASPVMPSTAPGAGSVSGSQQASGMGGIDLTGIGQNAAPLPPPMSMAALLGRGGGGGGGEIDPPMVPTGGYSNIGRRVESPSMRVLRSRVY